MLLEKIRKHGMKIMFFFMNILAVTAGVLFIKQKSAEEDLQKTITSSEEVDLQNYKSATDYALEAQQQIKAEKDVKINSVAGNPDTIQEKEVVPVTRTIPAVTETKTITKKPSSSSSSSKSSSSSAKTTTKSS